MQPGSEPMWSTSTASRCMDVLTTLRTFSMRTLPCAHGSHTHCRFLNALAAGPRVEKKYWFNSDTRCSVQMLPFTPISEQLLTADWVATEYPIVAKALPTAAQAWKVNHRAHELPQSV